MSAETKMCQNCKQEFRIEPEDFEFYAKIKVPPPTQCPKCRMIRRALFRNERHFNKRTCDLCKKDTISIYRTEAPFPVYCQDCYWSDNWDPLTFGLNFDENRPFLEQFSELSLKVPRVAIMNRGSTNSYYSHLAFNNRDSYMLIESSNNENIQYGYWMQHTRDCVDSAFCTKSELCYESIGIFDSYNLKYCQACFSCRDSWFLKNCTDCSNCFGCFNLKHKQYCFFNKQLSHEDYDRALEQYRLTTREGIDRAFRDAKEFYLTFPHKYAEITNSPGSIGNYITNSKKCISCFHGHNADDCRYSVHVFENIKDVFDADTAGLTAELLYEAMNTAVNISRARFTNRCWTGSDLTYCENLDSCFSCFGCMSMRNKSYCILNKQYSKEEYEKVVAKIIQQMTDSHIFGEFFPPAFSPFAYNETIAQEYFPITEEEAKKNGYSWKPPRDFFTKATIKYTELPQTIKETKELLLKEIISCAHDGACNEQCTGAFRITPAEFVFYKQTGLPLPHLCPNCRHVARIGRLNPFYLWPRKCQCAGARAGMYKKNASHFHGDAPCPSEFETSYAPDRPEMIYCEQCYSAEVA